MIKIKVIICIAIVLLLMTLTRTAGGETIVYQRVEVEIQAKDPLSYEQRAWLGALTYCESRGRVGALNKKDRDGTPSYGILQFKPSTFTYYAKRYGIDAKAGYKDADTQIKIVEQMILRNDVKWSTQFPDCTKQLGKPPRLSTSRVAKEH